MDLYGIFRTQQEFDEQVLILGAVGVVVRSDTSLQQPPRRDSGFAGGATLEVDGFLGSLCLERCLSLLQQLWPEQSIFSEAMEGC